MIRGANGGCIGNGFKNSALADLLDEDFRLAPEKDNGCIAAWTRCWSIVRRCSNDLRRRWQGISLGQKIRGAALRFDQHLFRERAGVSGKGTKRRYGYSRDKRPDCVQVVIALVVTPEGFPLAYEVMPGNTADKTTLRDFLKKIETLYGKADRVWVMGPGHPDGRGAVLAEMRAKPSRQCDIWWARPKAA